MVGTLAVLVLALLVPGALFLAALRGRPRGIESALEDLGHAFALSIGILVIVGTVLGYAGWYRFGATGAPVVEGVLLALLAALGAVAFRRIGTLRRDPRAHRGDAP